jgi:hypothetical protein
VTWRNIKERQASFFLGDPYLEISPFVVHQNDESIDLTNIYEDSLFATNFPSKPLIDLQNSPLEFNQEVSSSNRPLLKIHIPPLSFEAHNIILQNLMDELGGGIPGGNKPPPPLINP